MLSLTLQQRTTVVSENDQLFHHTHAVFSYKDGLEHRMAAGLSSNMDDYFDQSEAVLVAMK